jgi:hypothetical protein
MKKISLVLVSLLLTSAFSALSINLVAAPGPIATNFLPNNFQYGIDTETEIAYSIAVGEYIDSALDDYLSPNICIYSENCTVYTYNYVLFLLAYYNYDDIITYSKGHRGLPYYPENTNHISLLDHYGDGFWDSTIYTYTSAENVLTFIWHCQTALKYPGDDTIPQDEHGYYGMPYCWTHNQYMDNYGSLGSQVYLGWTDKVPDDEEYPQPLGGSPQYEYAIVPNTWNYLHVAYYFWYYMCDGATVNEALSNIAYLIYGEDSFYHTDLNGWLVAWGNMDLELP